jgi:hypothetical protein
MEFVHEAFKDSGESYMNNAIDWEEVRDLKNALV